MLQVLSAQSSSDFDAQLRKRQEEFDQQERELAVEHEVSSLSLASAQICCAVWALAFVNCPRLAGGGGCLCCVLWSYGGVGDCHYPLCEHFCTDYCICCLKGVTPPPPNLK